MLVYLWCWFWCILLCSIFNSLSKSPVDSRLSEHHPSFLEVIADFTDKFFMVHFHSFYDLSVINYCCFLSRSGSCWLLVVSKLLISQCPDSLIVKMAPMMAAVLRAPGKLCSFSYVLFVFLLFYVLDVVSITVYDRDTLLNIGCSVAQRKPDFKFLNAGGLFTDTASEPFIWVAQLRKRRRRRKRGKRAGVLVRLRRRAFRHPLPTILLVNVQSLDNKLCELWARISYQRETRDCCVICLTETWMSAMVPDSAIELTGFSVHRSDRTKEFTGKSRGGGVCFYINNLWCDERNIHSIKSFCSPDLEFHTLLCRPFWLPREFTAIIITAV